MQILRFLERLFEPVYLYRGQSARSDPGKTLVQCYYATIPYHTIHTCIWDYAYPACLACQTLPYDPKALETYSNGSKTLWDAPKCSQTFPNSLYAYVYLHTIPDHMGLMLTIQEYTPQRPYIWDRYGKLYQVLHVLEFQTSSFSRCVCVSCKKHIGILYLSITFLLAGESSQTVPKRSQAIPNDDETAFRKKNIQWNKSRRVLWFSERLESR